MQQVLKAVSLEIQSKKVSKTSKARRILDFVRDMKLGITFCFVVTLVLSAYVMAISDVVLQDLKLFVDGEEFVIKGMSYQPAPLGITSMNSDGYGGGGYCSAKLTPFNEYKSACYDSDYYDGSTANQGRSPPGPENSSGQLLPWWYNVWDRDFKKIKDLGVNTLRVYNFNFATSTVLSMFPNIFNAVNPSQGAKHRPFFDMAYDYGFKVIAPILQDESLLTNLPSSQLDDIINATVTELGDHPALLIWCLGNEMPLTTDAQLLSIVNEKMQVVRDMMKQIHNRSVPVSTAVVDDPTTYNFLVENLKVDLFISNAGYRNVYMDPLWTGEGNFPGWANVSKTHNLPFLIGEFGMPQIGDQVTLTMPDWFNQQWKEIVNHIDDGTIGACFFEYSDEIQKAGEQAYMGAVSFAAANTSDGKSSLDPNVWVPDLVQEKPYVYQAIKGGLGNSSYTQYNYNSNVFTLLGRSPAKLQNYVPSPSNSVYGSWIPVAPSGSGNGKSKPLPSNGNSVPGFALQISEASPLNFTLAFSILIALIVYLVLFKF